jgi:hypothetical protein
LLPSVTVGHVDPQVRTGAARKGGPEDKEATIVEPAAAHPNDALVTVTLSVTDENGNTQTTSKTIPAGPTKVTALKDELGVPPESALWVIDKHGKKRQLGDHVTEVVRDGDHYEAIVRGGVS